MSMPRELLESAAERRNQRNLQASSRASASAPASAEEKAEEKAAVVRAEQQAREALAIADGSRRRWMVDIHTSREASHRHGTMMVLVIDEKLGCQITEMELDTTRRAARRKYGDLTRAPQEEGARTRTPKRVRACPGGAA